MDNFYEKYLKYKTKYLDLKQSGGATIRINIKRLNGTTIPLDVPNTHQIKDVRLLLEQRLGHSIDGWPLYFQSRFMSEKYNSKKLEDGVHLYELNIQPDDSFDLAELKRK